MCGDWNVVQDQQLHLHENNIHVAARRKVLEIMEEWELVDPWRTNNYTKEIYVAYRGR